MSLVDETRRLLAEAGRCYAGTEHAGVVEELMETRVRPFFAGGRVALGPELFT